MNKLVHSCLAVVAAMLSSVPEVKGDERFASSQERIECMEQIRERAAAIRMQDWTQLDVIGRRFVQSCRGIYDRRHIADAYGAVSHANNELGCFQEALTQADAGIATHYLETASHIEKVKALLALDKIVEAKAAFEVADHVLHLAMERNNVDLKTARYEHQRETYQTDRNLYHAQLKILDNYRDLLGK